MPDKRRESAVATLGQDIYLVGGDIGNEVRTNAVLRYSTATGSWSYAASYPGQALDHFGWAVVNGKHAARGQRQRAVGPHLRLRGLGRDAGEVNPDSSSKGVYALHHEYDPGTNACGPSHP